MNLDDAVCMAEEAGVHVVFMPFPSAGAYYHQLGLIMIDSRRSEERQLATLLHEFFHAQAGHDGPQPAEVEHGIDQKVASLLVSPIEYEMAERIYGADAELIASELGQPSWIVEAYRDHLTRHGVNNLKIWAH